MTLLILNVIEGLIVHRVDLMRKEHITWNDIGLDYQKVCHGTMRRWQDEMQYIHCLRHLKVMN